MRHSQFLPLIGLALIVGCGGGGGAAVSSSLPDPTPPASPVGSAKFTVDARTGEVKVEPLSDSRAAFSGGALSFTSSLLLSEGSPERRVLRVTAKNNTQETIGVDGSFKLLFTNFQNANTPLTDLRSTVQTSTVWGTGASSTTLGGLSSAAIQGPINVAFDENQGSLFAINNAGQILTAKSGTVSKDSDEINLTGGLAIGPGFRLHGLNSWINIKLDSLPPTILVGTNSVSHVDGNFAEARFTDLKDIYLIRGTGPDDFEAVVADGTRVRLVQKNSAFPSGSVTTIHIAIQPITGVTYRQGVYFFTTANVIGISQGTNLSYVGHSIGGYVDGVQSNARFSNPSRLRWVGNSLFVVDTGNNRVRQLNLRPGGNVFSSNNWWVSTISGNGTASSVDGTANFMTHATPVAIAKGPGETLFVADQAGHKIRKIVPISNRFLDNFGDSTANPTEPVQLANATDYVPSNPTRTPLILENQSIPSGSSAVLGDWQFSLPEGLKSFSFIVTVEAETEVPGVLPSVANTGSGTRGSPLVHVRTLAGSFGPGYADGPSAAASFNTIQGISVTAAGDRFVCDVNNSAIRRISKSGKVTTVLGPNATGSTVDGVWPGSSCFSPNGIVSSPDGSQLYFSQTDGVIRRLDLVGQDPETRQNWKVTTIAGAIGVEGDIDNTIGSSARFSGSISGLAYVDERTIVIVDGFNHKIKIIERRGVGDSPTDYYVRLLAGSYQGYSDGPGNFAKFSYPAGITLTKSGYLYVTDTTNRRIRRLDLGGNVTTFAGSGVSGTQDSTSPLGAKFILPYGIGAEPSGYLYVTDYVAKQIRRISPTGVVSTVAGTASTMGSADGTGNSGTFQGPYMLAVGPGGDVYVTDYNRVRLLQRIVTN